MHHHLRSIVFLLALLPSAGPCQTAYQCTLAETQDIGMKQGCTVCAADSSAILFGGYKGKTLDRSFYSLSGASLSRIDLIFPGKGSIQNIMFFTDSILYVGGGMDGTTLDAP